MTDRSIRTVVSIAIAATVAGAVTASSPAIAAPPPLPATLDCGGAGRVLVNTNSGNAFRVLDTTQNFVIMSGAVVDDDGSITVVQAPNGTEKTRDLVTCTYVGPKTGRLLQVSGFFTPAT